MARCSNCSAPLVANTLVCQYCGTRNDIDLKAVQDIAVISFRSDKLCPECDKPLQTVELKLEKPLQIERCEQCYGLFFEPGEVELLLDSAVSPVFQVNLELISSINRDRYQNDKPVRYLKCPVCQFLMNRVSFGHLSGVVVDQCKPHGIWLEGGELTQLLEWKKAGGQLLDVQKREQKKTLNSLERPLPDLTPILKSRDYNDADLLTTVASLVFRLFE